MNPTKERLSNNRQIFGEILPVYLIVFTKQDDLLWAGDCNQSCARTFCETAFVATNGVVEVHISTLGNFGKRASANSTPKSQLQ
jgi:hypothetical protein